MAKNAGRRSQNASPRVALTIAGSDSSGGAGIQADLKTFAALGVYGLNAITVIVAETPGNVSTIEPVSSEMVRAQLNVLFKNFSVAAIKTGLLFSTEIISTIALALRASRSVARAPLVIDPVMVATSGDSLLREDAVETYEQELFPLARLITPNLNEAGRLLGEPIDDLKGMREAGARLTRKYGVAILLKGGHLPGPNATDLLFDGRTVVEFTSPFFRGVKTHGTGCTYSAAITAGLAIGLSLQEAVRRAKAFVTATITQHLCWETAPRKFIHALNHSPSDWK